MNKEKTPISYKDKEKANNLLNKNVLSANTEQGLGNYGILIGFDDNEQKFIVKMTGGKGTSWFHKEVKFSWIVEY